MDPNEGGKSMKALVSIIVALSLTSGVALAEKNKDINPDFEKPAKVEQTPAPETACPAPQPPKSPEKREKIDKCREKKGCYER